MFGFGKKKEETPSEESRGLFGRLSERLTRTRSGLTEGLASLVLGRKRIDDEVLEELETRLLTADVGVPTTRAIIDRLTERVSRNELSDTEALLAALREEMVTRLGEHAQPLQIPAEQEGPFVILMVGINGAGKTTTIGKLARRFLDQGLSVMLAAGDTFRAAAVEQLKSWGERHGVPVVAQDRAADPASVIFDAMQAARARGVDVLIADTAGRLHTQSNLMEELKKIVRVMAKADPAAPHETLLVLDGGIGQNALAQARQFHEAIGLSGLVVTKLDGTARGGILFAVTAETGLPVRFIGVGEQAADLRPFEPTEFVEALTGE